MKTSVATRYAVRSLLRHPRRTLLSTLGVGLGCAVCMFAIGFVRGESDMYMDAAAASGAGHLRVVPVEWTKRRDTNARVHNWQEVLERLRTTEGISVATPRARVDALLGFGSRLAGVQIAGVDPVTEQSANRLVGQMAEGHYLRPGARGEVIMGRTLVERLDVELDDQIMITLSGRDDEMKRAMLVLAGIVETGSRELDASICQITLADFQQISGRPGAGELTMLVGDPDELEPLAVRLAAELPPGTQLLTWKEIMPELAAGVQVDETWTVMVVSILMTVVFLGIASAQLAAVMERRREFAVLSALGMKGRRLVAIMIVEGLVQGFAGAVLGLAIGAPCTYYVATRGIDFSAFWGEEALSISNILVDPVFHGDFGWWLVPLAFGLALGATLLSSLYPAWYATRTDPASALRVEH